MHNCHIGTFKNQLIGDNLLVRKKRKMCDKKKEKRGEMIIYLSPQSGNWINNTVYTMVLIIDGNSEKSAHVRNNLCYLFI